MTCSACAVPTEEPAPQIWTIGHGARSLEEFIAWNRLAIAFRTPAGSYRPDLAR
jgi:hypothetical protein